MGRELAGARWVKSSHSGDNGGACVEVALNMPGVVAVRDSKDSAGTVLVFAPGQWRAFAAGVLAGEFGAI